MLLNRVILKSFEILLQPRICVRIAMSNIDSIVVVLVAQ